VIYFLFLFSFHEEYPTPNAMVNDNSTGQDSRRAFHLSTPNSLNSSSPLLSPSSRNEECFRKQNRFVPMERPNPSSSHSPASSSSFEVARTQQIAVPTTFVQADTSSFRELVQKLTGISDDSQEKFPITMPARYANRGGGGGGGVSGKQHATQADGGVGVAGVGLYFKQGPDISKPGVEVGPRKSAFKLHERRQSMRKLEIKLGLTSLRHNPSSGLSPRTSGELRSPNPQDIPALVPSPVTPLGSDPFENGYSPSSVITTPTSCNAAYGPPTPTSESPSSAISEEERAIAEKGFYLHPSPLNTPRGSEPELLPLFPLQSPRQSSS
jgi:hypothetical protein